MFQRFSLVLAMTLGAVSSASSQTVFGAGTLTCGEWQQFRTQAANEKNLGNAYQLHAWVDGFLSGYNIGGTGGPDFLLGSSNGVAYYSWIDNYCSAKPLDHVGQAVMMLVRELKSRIKQK
jgi:hypothetical protein